MKHYSRFASRSATRRTINPGRTPNRPEITKIELGDEMTLVRIVPPKEFINGDLITPTGLDADLHLFVAVGDEGADNPFAGYEDRTHLEIQRAIDAIEAADADDRWSFESRNLRITRFGQDADFQFPPLAEGRTIWAVATIVMVDPTPARVPPGTPPGQMVDVTPTTPPPPPTAPEFWTPPPHWADANFWAPDVPTSMGFGDLSVFPKGPLNFSVELVPGVSERNADRARWPIEVYEEEDPSGASEYVSTASGGPFARIVIRRGDTDAVIHEHHPTFQGGVSLEENRVGTLREACEHLAFYFGSGFWKTKDAPKIPNPS